MKKVGKKLLRQASKQRESSARNISCCGHNHLQNTETHLLGEGWATAVQHCPVSTADSDGHKIQRERRVLMKGMDYTDSYTSLVSFKDALVKAFEELRTKSLLDNVKK